MCSKSQYLLFNGNENTALSFPNAENAAFSLPEKIDEIKRNNRIWYFAKFLPYCYYYFLVKKVKMRTISEYKTFM